MENNAGHAVPNARMLSPEAQLYRRMLRNHIRNLLGPRAILLADNSLPDEPVNSLNAGAATDQTSQSSNSNDVSDEQLQESFDHWTSTFERQFREQINGYVSRLEITAASIEHQVRGVINHLFEDGQYNWGRLVALSAFITYIALDCDRNELSFVIVPLIDFTARSIDEQNTLQFIRSNGGWRGFFEHFSGRGSEASVSRSRLSRIVACAIGALGAGALAAYLVRK